MSTVLSQSLEAAYREQFPTSARLFERGRKLFPNGVTHDARALKPFPIYVDRAEGARKWDVDGNEIVDYFAGHGALLLGHSHPAVVEAVKDEIGGGVSRIGVETWSSGHSYGFGTAIREGVDAEWIDITGVLDEMRLVKSPAEIASLIDDLRGQPTVVRRRADLLGGAAI